MTSLHVDQLDSLNSENLASKRKKIPTRGFYMLPHETSEVLCKLISTNPSAAQVFLALSRRANREGVCWPSAKTLAKDAGVTERSVFRSIKTLEKSGIITVSRQKKESNDSEVNRYKLTHYEECWKIAQDGMEGTDTGVRGYCHSSQEGTDTADRGVLTRVSPELYKENYNHRTRKDPPTPPVTDQVDSSADEPNGQKDFLADSTENTPKTKKYSPEEAFGIFWDLCPYKIGKDKAERAFLSLIRKKRHEQYSDFIELFAEELAGAYRTHYLDQEKEHGCQQKGERLIDHMRRLYMPHPASWLNSGNWEIHFIAEQAVDVPLTQDDAIDDDEEWPMEVFKPWEPPVLTPEQIKEREAMREREANSPYQQPPIFKSEEEFVEKWKDFCLTQGLEHLLGG